VEERLKPQISLAKQQGLITAAEVKQFAQLFELLDGLYPKEDPALVHGDLWSGNYLIDGAQQPVLIDPAVAYAHREADIAMTTLFGGFQDAFYAAYQEVFPLQAAWRERIHLWNLYPLMVHVNLFGTSYLAMVKNSLGRYV
jgi:fructosamine-3-kinase